MTQVIPETIDIKLYHSLKTWQDLFEVRVFCKKNNVSRERVLEGFDKLEKLKLVAFVRDSRGRYLRRRMKFIVHAE